MVVRNVAWVVVVRHMVVRKVVYAVVMMIMFVFGAVLHTLMYKVNYTKKIIAKGNPYIITIFTIVIIFLHLYFFQPAVLKALK